MMTYDEFMTEIWDAQERLKYEELRRRGIITDAVILINPKHKGILEEALHSMGIQKIPIVYSHYVEKDKMYFSTDTDFVTATKRCLIYRIT